MAVSCTTCLKLKAHFLGGVFFSVVFQMYVNVRSLNICQLVAHLYITLVSMSPPTSQPTPVLSRSKFQSLDNFVCKTFSVSLQKISVLSSVTALSKCNCHVIN